ncbi:NAD(P)-binding domain-containing protein [Pantoea rwandensis]|uniref:NAD(P)-binding domain-containing protein n=1 Tax=Pantoea rwandensis TaxID=1076550 RepID=UPI001B80BD74|nr:NAD(P)-binding domain-containing protein [Pantoea rwandensis]
MKIAFIGVGRMGSRMASRLLEAGHELNVYDPYAPAMDGLKQQGAAAAGSPAEAAEGAEIIMLSLPSPATFTDAVVGETGVLTKVSPGAIVIDFSTVDPATTKDIAAQCARKKRLLPRLTGQRRSGRCRIG